MRVVEWKEQITQSGIQLGGLTSVEKRGEILSTHAFPATDAAGRQGIITIVTVRAFETGAIISMPAEMCRFVGNLVQMPGSEDKFVEPLHKSE